MLLRSLVVLKCIRRGLLASFNSFMLLQEPYEDKEQGEHSLSFNSFMLLLSPKGHSILIPFFSLSILLCYYMVNTFYSDEKGLYIKLSILLCYYSINYEKSFINEIVTFNSFMLLLTLDTNVWSMDSGNLSILLCYYTEKSDKKI